MYNLARQNMINANKDRPGPNLGKIYTEEERKKLSNALKGRINGPMSKAHKDKLRTPKSEEHKKKISEARKRLKGDPRIKKSEEVKKKIGEKNKGRKLPTKICEYCNKSVSNTNYIRWHGNNCKFFTTLSITVIE